MADRIGQQLSNYRLIRLLGQGGFANVYLAEHLYLGTQAAIKILQARLTSSDVESFRSEARTIALLEHPHIVQVLDFGVEGSTPYLVMDYAPHGTLRQRYPKGTRLQLATVIQYVKQVADALQYTHDRKLIHRDIKPENMLIGRSEEILLSDFGIAVLAQSSRDQAMQKAVGTISYMAPEQIQGKPCFASDQYALGIVVYEWICGERPFRGSFTEIATQHIFAPPTPLHEKVPQLSSTVEDVVLLALAKDPQQRFASVEAFANALEKANLSEASAISHSRDILAPQAPPSRPFEASASEPIGFPSSDKQPITWAVNQEPATTKKRTLPITGSVQQALPPTTPARKRVPSKGQVALLLVTVLLLIAGGSYAYSVVSTYQAQATATAKAAPTATVKAAVDDYRTYVAAYGIMYGFDAHHTRNNPYERIINVGNVSQLSQKWTAQTGYTIISSPAVANGVVYVGSQDGKLYAFDAATGQQEWAAQTGQAIRSSPAVANGVVYLGSYDHNVYAFDAASGQKKWTAPTGGAIESSPAVVNGLIYVGSDDGKLYAFDGATGKWVAPTGNQVYSSPAVTNGVAYVGSLDHKLYAIDVATSEPKWAAQTGDAIISSPAVANGVVYVGSLDHKLYAFDAASGQQKWAAQTGDAITTSSPAVANGVVYVGSLDHKLYAFDAASGQQKWVAQTGHRIFSSPVVANGMVYVGSQDGKLYAFSLT